MTEKNYVNGLIIKEKTFDNGGTQLKLNIKLDDLMNSLKSMEDKGWVNLIVSRRKEASETGITHYAYQDTWKPTAKTNTKTKAVTVEDDDLPF